MKTQNQLDYRLKRAADKKPFRTFEHLEVYQVARQFRAALTLREDFSVYRCSDDRLDETIAPPASTVERLHAST
jgi:hypothetical protein